MTNVAFADLTSGYERFDALAKNLEGIFDKVYTMRGYRIDISYYENKFDDFKKEFNLVDGFLKNTKMPFKSVQTTYEGFALNECNKKLEALTNEFEENVTPIYNIYLLFNSLDDSLEYNEDIEIIISKSKSLLDQINANPTHNKIDIKRLMEKAYDSLYNALIYEETYNRHDILDYVERKNNSANRENISKILRDKLKDKIRKGIIDRKDIDEESIAHIDDGIGYDFLSREFLNTLAKKDNDEILRKVRLEKEKAIKDVTTLLAQSNAKLSSLKDTIHANDNEIKNIQKKIGKIRLKTFAIALIPIMLGTGSYALGKNLSNKITEYATYTRTVNLTTNETVGDIKTEYDEHVTTYVATVTMYGPWVKKPNGGYVRNATAYEYNVPKNVDENYHISLEDIEGNVREKYRFSEAKPELDPNENTTDSTVLITETYQDKSINKKSTKYVIPFIIGGNVLGIVLAFLVYKFLFDYESSNYELEKLKRTLRRNKNYNSQYENELKTILGHIKVQEEEMNKINAKYGITK